MDGNFFFVLGIILVIGAVALAFLGIRGADSFPPGRGVLVGATALFAVLVGATMAFAIVKSKDEQDKRNEELAKEEQLPENSGQNPQESTPPASPGGQPQASSGGNQQAPTPVATTPGTQTQSSTGGSESLDVSSPADGGLVFEPNGLTAKPGNLTISYDNPSPVPHSIAVATANGNVLGEVQPFTQSTESVQLSDLQPGKYVFYCTVPGHREAGMEGDLTVTGGPTP
jgi:plastocyanin